MNLNLSNEEANLLADVLKNALSNMKEETGKTENYDWRVALKKDEESLRGIISRLESGRGRLSPRLPEPVPVVSDRQWGL